MRPARQRYLARGRVHGEGKSSVEFIKMVRNESRGADNTRADTNQYGLQIAETNSTHQAQPDLELEWELLKRVDPEASSGYEADAARQYK